MAELFHRRVGWVRTQESVFTELVEGARTVGAKNPEATGEIGRSVNRRLRAIEGEGAARRHSLPVPLAAGSATVDHGIAVPERMVDQYLQVRGRTRICR